MANNQFTFKSTEERLMASILPEPNSGCWLWTGYVNDDGYGITSAGRKGKTVGAHVLMYTLAKGKISDGLELDHKCRVRCCVNPEHLEPVTHKVNMLRGVATKAMKDRAFHSSKTHCPNGHEYSAHNTYVYITKEGFRCRYCRTCNRKSHAAA